MSVGIEIGAAYERGPEDSPGYGLINAGHAGGAERSAWLTGNPAVDKYISAFDAALRNKRVGGATYLARDLETAARLASLENMAKGPPTIGDLPTFGNGGVGGGAGSYQATLRENPFEGRLMNLLNDPSSLANDPGYKFEMQQGQQALARSAAARNMTGSGNTLAALLEQSQGFAAKRRGQELDRLGGFMQGRDQTNASLYGSDASAGASRYGTDVGSKTSMWNTAQKINADNYWNAQQRLTGGGGGGGASWSPTLGSSAGGGGGGWSATLGGGSSPQQVSRFTAQSPSSANSRYTPQESPIIANMTWGQANAFNNSQRGY